MDDIFIEIPGVPVAWRSHAGFGRKSWNPLWREREYYQSKIRDQYKGDPIKLSVGADYTFYIRIPQSTPMKSRTRMLLKEIRPAKRPDRDNLAKFLSDCLQGIVIVDDSIIVEGKIEKYYGEIPMTMIRIYGV